MTVKTIRSIFFPLVGVVASAGGGAALAADAANGARIADRWCASCHVVRPDQPRASADVPPFSAIAAKYPDIAPLTAFLGAPYPRMPAMALSRDEIADLVAYIRTQGPPRAEPPAPPEKDNPPKPPTRG